MFIYKKSKYCDKIDLTIIKFRQGGYMTFFEKHKSQFQEDLSKSYMRSVCASQGITFHDHSDRDNDGTDCTLKFYDTDNKQRELKVQVKSTQNINVSGEFIQYDIEAATHNLLCDNEYRATSVFLLEVNSDISKWAELTENELLVRHKMYFYDYSGESVTTNTTTKRISIPIDNVVDPNNFLQKCYEIFDNWLSTKEGN